MTQKHWMVLLLVFAAVLITGYGFKNHFDAKASAFLSITNDNIAEQRDVIEELQLGLRTGGDSYDRAVAISDCSNNSRARFDELLSGLADLSRAELQELDGLFNSCAYYYATVQTVSVAQLVREVKVYEDMLRAAAVFDKEAETQLENSDVWNEMLTKERERGKLHVELVETQREIIKELLSYKHIDHPDVTALVAEGKEIRDNLIFLTQQIDELRQKL